MTMYVCVNEYDGAITGTLEYILEHIEEDNWNIGDCTFYELGKEIAVELRAVEK